MDTTETLNSQQNADNANAWIQSDSTNPQNTTVQAETVTKEEYLNAQSFGTKARQAEIAMATKLVQTNGSELHSIEDVKVKDAVTKQLLNMNYAEASAVLGANFDISKGTGDDSDWDTGKQTDSKIERQLKLLQYKDAQREVESAIDAYSAKNPELFKGNAETMKDRIRTELENISSNLNVEERVRRAATVSLWNPMDKESLAYNLLQNGQISTPKGTTNAQEEAKTKVTKFQDELRDLWWIKK